jgi:hypothetical protein
MRLIMAIFALVAAVFCLFPLHLKADPRYGIAYVVLIVAFFFLVPENIFDSDTSIKS